MRGRKIEREEGGKRKEKVEGKEGKGDGGEDGRKWSVIGRMNKF